MTTTPSQETSVSTTIRSIPRAAVQGYLRALRLPVDTASRVADRYADGPWAPSIAYEAFEAKVFLLECSFVEEGDLPRARNYGHLHVDDVAERADLFANEAPVLTHLTLRGTPAELRRAVARRLPASLASRTVLFLPGE